MRIGSLTAAGRLPRASGPGYELVDVLETHWPLSGSRGLFANPGCGEHCASAYESFIRAPHVSVDERDQQCPWPPICDERQRLVGFEPFPDASRRIAQL